MKPNLFRKHTVKIFFWITTIILVIAGIYLAILLTTISNIKIEITLTTLGMIDLILLIFILAIQATSRLFIRLNFYIEYQKNENAVIQNAKIIISNFSWFFISILTIAIYFIQIGGISFALDESFAKVIKNYWWIAMILLIINFVILTMYYLITKEILSKDNTLKEQLIQQYNENKNNTNKN
ncbi:hypothetical protein [Spiroplasma endosymbiont of Labia minor]|uniref:hypothetical protein n=1 Tax=Spiroplasma endosymbiont of Labia minor TaxID=3066305 RepID=UPI0030D05E95